MEEYYKKNPRRNGGRTITMKNCKINSMQIYGK